MTDIAKHAEWNNVVDIKSARLLLELAATLAFVAVPLPGGALLPIPVWPIVIAAAALPVVIVFAYIYFIRDHPCPGAFRGAEIMFIALDSTSAFLTKLFAATVAYFGEFTDPARVILSVIIRGIPRTFAFPVAELKFGIGNAIWVTLKDISALSAFDADFWLFGWHKKHLLLAVDGTLAEGAPMPTGGTKSLPVSMVSVNYDYTLSMCNYTIGRGA